MVEDSQLGGIQQTYLCQECHTFPIIDFVDKENIYYNCGCENKEQQQNKKENYQKNIKKYLEDISPKKNLIIEEKCSCKEGTISHYCFDCKKNICDNCQKNKENKNHKIEKIEEIKKERKTQELVESIKKIINNEKEQ